MANFSRRQLLQMLASVGLSTLLSRPAQGLGTVTAAARKPRWPNLDCFYRLRSPVQPVETAPPFVGLHASADPDIRIAEHCAFAELRPSLIKILSYHSAADIAWLNRMNPGAHWLMRAFLNFGGRVISPDQFLTDTVNDVSRALVQLPGKEVVIELHNEPNLVLEGLGSSWRDGGAFAGWFLDVLDRYRAIAPGRRFIYPGLSPGATIDGVRQGHVAFLEASRAAVAAADGLGAHIYWSNDYTLHEALAVLDDLHGRFPTKPIWITEASHNKAGLAPQRKARQYLQFIAALKKRPFVQGVTFFVATASNPAFAEEVWVGRGIAGILGRR